MLKPFTGKDIQPYYPTVIDIETSTVGEIIAIGFGYQLGDTRYYAYYDDIAVWYRDFCSLALRYKDDKRQYKRLTKIYAHNGAGFDYLAIYKWLYQQNEILDGRYFMADSCGIGCSFTLKTLADDVMLFDSYRMLPASLDDLSKTFDVNHKKQAVPKECKNDYLKFKNNYPEMFREYLHNDVVGLQEILFKFWTQIYGIFGNVGELPMTLPSLALRIYSKSMDGNLLTPDAPKLKLLEREAYKGGLTLCMMTGVFENVNVYDVNSMYPAMMRDKLFPASYKGYWTRNFKPNKLGIWRGTFVQTNRAYPPFMFDHETGATYEGNGAYTTEEINRLIEIGGTFQLDEGYIYTQTSHLFSAFIGRVYDMRKEAQTQGDNALAYVLKIMMNSLYGKFAQRETGYDVVVASGAKQKELTAEKVPYILFGDFMAVPSARFVPHVFVGLAAHITAYARVHLHKLMCEQIDSGHFVVYCDTDSVHTVNGHMETSNELGGVKLEYSGTGAYAGKKIYAIRTEGKDKIKAKGIGRRTKQDLSFEKIKRLAEDKSIKQPYTFEVFPSVKEVLGNKAKPAVMMNRTRQLANTGGIWDSKKEE